MASKERFLATYNNPIRATEAASNPVAPVGVVSPSNKPQGSKGPTGLGTWFIEDERNMGGKHLIDGQLDKHQYAVKKANSVVAEQNRPPHAHISKVVNGKTDFAHDKKLKRKRRGLSVGKTILTREMKNIDPVLLQQETFSEVRETFRRIKDVRTGSTYE